MPETRETAGSGLVAQLGLETAQATGSCLIVEHIVADATGAEAEATDAPDCAKQGLPYPLSPTSTIVRGSLSHQTPVYPPMLHLVDTSYPPVPYPPSLRSLTLSAVQSTHRALILNFGTLVLMARLLYTSFIPTLISSRYNI